MVASLDEYPQLTADLAHRSVAIKILESVLVIFLAILAFIGNVCLRNCLQGPSSTNSSRHVCNKLSSERHFDDGSLYANIPARACFKRMAI